jgi:hypothetical protein
MPHRNHYHITPFFPFLVRYNSDIELLHLLRQPLLRLGNSVVELGRLGTRALPAGLLAARLAANDVRDGLGPLLGRDALGGEVLVER